MHFIWVKNRPLEHSVFYIFKELEKLLPPRNPKEIYKEDEVFDVELLGEDHIRKEDYSRKKEAYDIDGEDDDESAGPQGMQCATH